MEMLLKVSPFYMPVWWNGIHSGLRNRGESMRVQFPPQVLCAYIRIGIGAALRMQSGNRWRFESSYAHYAGLVELADTVASKASDVSHKGSNPLSCTISPRSRTGICIGFKIRDL